MKLTYPVGATPIDPNEMAGLIPKGIRLQKELNELEEQNILEAASWAFGRRRKDWLSVRYLLELHKRMLGHVWRWAGKPRTTNKNLGVDKSQIQEELKKLCDDAKYWIDHRTYDWNELAVRFHYRLVSIHPFPNGNGRHARLMADVLLYQNHQPRLTWGGRSLVEESQARSTYLAALKEADRGIVQPLIDFARS